MALTGVFCLPLLNTDPTTQASSHPWGEGVFLVLLLNKIGYLSYNISVNLKNKHILISGASSGIGLALAKKLITEGASVTNLDVKSPENEAEGMDTILADITNSEALENALKGPRSPIDVLICNAGIMRRGTFLDSSEQDFDQIFDVNVKGTWLLLKEAQNHLNKDATVMIMGSRYSLKPRTDPALYGLTKLTQYYLGKLAEETLPSFTFKYILPGPTDTPLARHGVSDSALIEKEKVMLSPDELADKIMELLGSNKSHLIFDEETQVYRLE